jgi:hypothetical protein
MLLIDSVGGRGGYSGEKGICPLERKYICRYEYVIFFYRPTVKVQLLKGAGPLTITAINPNSVIRNFRIPAAGHAPLESLDHRVLGNGLSTSSGTLPGRQWHTIY